ncbi:MAG: hypothetical protein JEZ06_19900 [Anaerolineaceae bacterium]|nr:hypothetical protein [Anaerolineaceae bacterium]
MKRRYEQTTLSHLLNRLFNEFERINNPYCVCGNYHALPYYTDNDVDIWARDPKATINIIEKICSELQLKIYLKNSNSTGANLFICSLSPDRPDLIHLDVLQECRWHSFLPLVRSELIEKNRRRYKNFMVANETVDAAMHLLYPLSHFGKITPKYYDDISKASRNEEFWEIIEKGWGASFTQKILPLVKNGSWSALEKEFLRQKFKLTLHSLVKIRKSEIKAFLSFITYNIERLIKPSGLFIAFVGPDGCGKTTVQNNLNLFFEKGFTKGKKREFYWRPFFLPRLKAFLPGGRQCIDNDIKKGDPSARLALRQAGVWTRTIHSMKLLYYWSDYIVGRLKYQGTWSRGGVVCFDRYWDDLEVFPERFGINVSKWFVRLLGVFVPKPDIVFYLHAEPEVLINRKPELPFEEIRAQVEQYKTLCYRNKNFELIDGSQPQEDVLSDVIRICLAKMSKRYPVNQ